MNKQERRTRVNAAFRLFSCGFARSARGGLGGRAAICGDAASLEREEIVPGPGALCVRVLEEGESGMTAGGLSCSISSLFIFDEEAIGICAAVSDEACVPRAINLDFEDS